MTLLAAKAIQRMEHALYGEPAPTIGMLDMLNEAGEIFCTMREWGWMGDAQTTLDLIADQDWVVLPPDFAEETATAATDSLTWKYRPVSSRVLNNYRTQSLSIPSSWFVGTVIHDAIPIANWLSYTDDLGSDAWSSGDATVTQGTTDVRAPDGLNGAAKLQDLSPAATQSIWQRQADVAPTLGRWMCGSVWYYPGSSAFSQMFMGSHAAVSGAGGGPPANRVRVGASFSVTGGVPTVSTLDGTNISTDNIRSGIIEDDWAADLGWYRLWVAMKWEIPTWTGATAIAWGIAPASNLPATPGNCYAWRPQINEGAYPAPLSVNSGDIPLATGRPEPRLDIWPTPRSTTLEGLTMRYRRCWALIESDNDTIYVPSYCEPLFLRVCEEVALGHHERDKGLLEQRLDLIKRTNLFDDCAREDLNRQGQGGRISNSAFDLAFRRPRTWHEGGLIPDPS